jgi:hypothetical protein
MALFPKPAETQNVGLFILNKRLIRITIGVAAFFFVAFGLLWRHPYDSEYQYDESEPQPKLSAEQPTPGINETSGFYPYETVSDYDPVSLDPSDKTTADLCATFPKHFLGLIQPVLKIGHSEDRKKLDAQFDSVSACFQPEELLIFSDLDEPIRNHTAIDILANLPPKYYDEEENPDISSYLLQRELKKNGTLDKDKEATKKIDGWKIDKFKFLPQIERAWLLKPNRPFYFFYETDTYVYFLVPSIARDTDPIVPLNRYVVWDNVYRFLSTFDPDTPVYMGSPSPGRHDNIRDIKTYFANGGPGYALSRGAVKALIHRDVAQHGQYVEPSVTEKWLPLLTNECCGDSVVGWTLWNSGVALQGYWPMFNPHPLHKIPFSDQYWCQPIMTLHKTSPSDMVDVWKWEFGQRKHEVCHVALPVVIAKALTFAYSVHCFTPTIGDSSVLVPLTPWRTGTTVIGAPGDPIQKKESTPLKSAKRHVKGTKSAFNGTGEAETKRSVFSHEILHMGRRESLNNKTTSGSTSGLAG